MRRFYHPMNPTYLNQIVADWIMCALYYYYSSSYYYSYYYY